MLSNRMAFNEMSHVRKWQEKPRRGQGLGPAIHGKKQSDQLRSTVELNAGNGDFGEKISIPAGFFCYSVTSRGFGISCNTGRCR